MTSFFPPEGPALPPFRTLLVTGSYHPSAPIHLCLSHAREQPRRRVILIAPDRKTLTTALTSYNDHWLHLHGLTGSSCSVSNRIQIFYPPSPSHLALLLATFRVSKPSDGPSFNAKTHLDLPPSLLVLLEPSFYFLNDGSEPSSTLSSYLSLIAHAIDALSFLSADHTSWPCFALFESQLDQLRLPILRPPHSHPRRDLDPDDDQNPRGEPILQHVQKYFECVAAFNQGLPTSAFDDSQGVRKKMILYDRSADTMTTWEWSEVLRRPQGPAAEKQCTAFVWHSS